MLTINFLALRKSELKVERTPYTEVVAVYESLKRKDFDLFMAFYNPVTFLRQAERFGLICLQVSGFPSLIYADKNLSLCFS